MATAARTSDAEGRMIDARVGTVGPTPAPPSASPAAPSPRRARYLQPRHDTGPQTHRAGMAPRLDRRDRRPPPRALRPDGPRLVQREPPGALPAPRPDRRHDRDHRRAARHRPLTSHHRARRARLAGQRADYPHRPLAT